MSRNERAVLVPHPSVAESTISTFALAQMIQLHQKYGNMYAQDEPE